MNNTLIMSILNEMNEKLLWEGTIKSIYDRLFEITQPDKNDPSFPKTERKIRSHLERAKTTLMQQGIYFSIGKRTAQGIPITFERKHLPENIKSSTSSTLGTQKQTVNVDNEANELDFVSSGTSGIDIAKGNEKDQVTIKNQEKGIRTGEQAELPGLNSSGSNGLNNLRDLKL